MNPNLGGPGVDIITQNLKISFVGFGVVMWQVGPLPLVPAFLVGVSVNPDSFTSDTAPCQCSGRAAEDGPGTWLCAANVEDPDGTWGFDVSQCWLLWLSGE